MEFMEVLDRGIALISARSSQALMAAQVAAVGTVLILAMRSLRRAWGKARPRAERAPRPRRSLRMARARRRQARREAPAPVAPPRPETCPEELRQRIDALEARILALQLQPGAAAPRP